MTWQEAAACIDEEPDQFFPEEPVDRHHVRLTLAICNRCPVATECLADDLTRDAEDIWGIRGGMVQADRRRLRRKADR